MKTTQFRRYQIDPEHYDEWLAWWRSTLVPAREAFGFTLEGSWAARDTAELIWFVSAPVDRAGFEALAAAWDASPERNEALASIPKPTISAKTEIVEEA